ncbi:MAG: hypothetical protein J5J06_15970 [Phycisphaerae bacterium]|nr:hypothetical protein [Phycisphaerae bacterium]
MKTEEGWIEGGVVVAESALLKVERGTGYGSVPGLEDEELADPDELERQVMIAEWGPILAIPITWKRPLIRPQLDGNNKLDWGAFGTVDFDRLRPTFNPGLRLAQELEEDLRNAVIMLGVVSQRLANEARGEALRMIHMFNVEADYFDDWSQWAFARWYLRARTLRRRIRGLRRAAWEARRAAAEQDD